MTLWFSMCGNSAWFGMCIAYRIFTYRILLFLGQALPAANAPQTAPFANIAERKRLLSIQLLLLEQEGVLQSPLCSLAFQGSPPAPIPAPQQHRSPWQCHIAIVPACTAAMRGRGDPIMCKRAGVRKHIQLFQLCQNPNAAVATKLS